MVTEVIDNEEDFALQLKFDVKIYVPEEIRKNQSIILVIDIDSDIEVYSYSTEDLRVWGTKMQYADQEVLNATQKKYKKEFSVQADECYFVSYRRDIRISEYKLWKSKRHTGMRVSWYYNDTVHPGKIFLSDNQEFVTLVNALHENRTGLKEELMKKRHELLKDRHWCDEGRLGDYIDYYYEDGDSIIELPSIGNVSTEPVYTDNITQETLATAGRLYFYFREGFIRIFTLAEFKEFNKTK